MTYKRLLALLAFITSTVVAEETLYLSVGRI